ncbi:MAG: hypothetical protein AABX71_00690 [Nanoarchaeota archaeon]
MARGLKLGVLIIVLLILGSFAVSAYSERVSYTEFDKGDKWGYVMKYDTSSPPYSYDYYAPYYNYYEPYSPSYYEPTEWRSYSYSSERYYGESYHRESYSSYGRNPRNKYPYLYSSYNPYRHYDSGYYIPNYW